MNTLRKYAPPISSIHLIFLLGLGLFFLLFLSGFFCEIVMNSDFKFQNFGIAPIQRLLALFICVSAIIFTINGINRTIHAWFTKKWWGFGFPGRTANQKWLNTLQNIIAVKKSDITKFSKSPLNIDEIGIVNYILTISFSFIFGGFFGIIMSYIIFPRPIGLSLLSLSSSNPTGEHVLNASGNLTAYLAIIASITTIIFTYYQLRSKVRAESRQDWINKVRTLTADVIFLIGEYFSAIEQGYPIKSIRSRIDESRVELELMLNPSEQDHRILTMLIRACVLDHKIEFDKIIINTVFNADNFLNDENREIIELLKLERISEGRDQDSAISYLMATAHIILKREWERVSNIR